MDSSIENKKTQKPSDIIKGKLFLQYDFMKTILGQENMEKIIKYIEDKKGDLKDFDDEIKNIFGDDINEKNILKLKNFANKIIKGCYK